MDSMKKCRRCGQEFICKAEEKEEKCWCVGLPPLEPLVEDIPDCFCPSCLSQLIKKKEMRVKPSISLIEGEDFYYENGFLVFTAAYHLKRGYCCKSGCRHCPYRDTRLGLKTRGRNED